jgi:hypothetical protein
MSSDTREKKNSNFATDTFAILCGEVRRAVLNSAARHSQLAGDQLDAHQPH